MKLTNSEKHLTYCTNIHPGETWEEVLQQLKENIPDLKGRIAPENKFGIGLRLSAQAAEQLLQGDELDHFKQWLDDEGLYVFTMNGFPYGNFHQTRVKDLVYKPDWRSDERVNYTLNLVKILAAVLPDDMDGGISTSPLSYKHWLDTKEDEEETFRESAENLAHVAWAMHKVKEEQQKNIHVDIEPEPDCLLENSSETIEFFEKWLLPVGSSYMNSNFEVTQEEAEQILLNHIRVCYDTCHFAVEYENPEEALNAFQSAGIKIGKVQISAAIKKTLNVNPGDRDDVVEKLRPFEESTYLHQVIERWDDDSLHHYGDLTEALTNIHTPCAREWRIHYHVPIFVDEFNGLQSTRDDIIGSLEHIGDYSDCRHFEIETYTWEVLPDHLKTNLKDSIEREIRWTLDLMEKEWQL